MKAVLGAYRAVHAGDNQDLVPRRFRLARAAESLFIALQSAREQTGKTVTGSNVQR